MTLLHAQCDDGIDVSGTPRWDHAGEEGNRATGPGALDMKGGLAIIRTALAALADVGALADLPLRVVCVSDEEVGSPTSAPHLRIG